MHYEARKESAYCKLSIRRKCLVTGQNRTHSSTNSAASNLWRCSGFSFCVNTAAKSTWKEGNISSAEQQELSISWEVKFTFFYCDLCPKCSLENKREKCSYWCRSLSLLKLLTVFNSFIFTGSVLLSANWELGVVGTDNLNGLYSLLTNPWIITIMDMCL